MVQSSEIKPAITPPLPGPALQRLSILVGNWDVVGTYPLFATLLHGRSSFERLSARPLFVWRSDFDAAALPNTISLIGYDDYLETCSMFYSDGRGVLRIYGMSLLGSLWKMWRSDATGLTERFVGGFSGDGNVIVGYWAWSTDGSNWEHDLDLIFTRVR